LLLCLNALQQFRCCAAYLRRSEIHAGFQMGMFCNNANYHDGSIILLSGRGCGNACMLCSRSDAGVKSLGVVCHHLIDTCSATEARHYRAGTVFFHFALQVGTSMISKHSCFLLSGADEEPEFFLGPTVSHND
jgi:hypothetical protein